MLAQKNRFHGHHSLDLVYRNGFSLSLDNVGLRYLNTGPTSVTRGAVVISKKVAKSAVSRNRIRRQIYELIRLNLDNFKQPVSLIITIHHEKVLQLTPNKLKALILNLFIKSNLIDQNTSKHAIVETKKEVS